MARVVTEAFSLRRRHVSLLREAAVLRRVAAGEAVLAAVLLLAGAIRGFRSGRAGLLWAGAIAAAAAGAHGLRIRESRRESRSVRSGWRGEENVARALAEGLDETHSLFHDLRIRDGRSTAQMDHVAVSPNGVFVIETKNWKGRIEGGRDDDSWRQRARPGDPPTNMTNPVRQVLRQAEFLRVSLSRAGLAEPEVRALVVFSSPDADVEAPDAGVPVLSPAGAVRHISGFPAEHEVSDETIDAVVRHLVRLSGRGDRPA